MLPSDLRSQEIGLEMELRREGIESRSTRYMIFSHMQKMARFFVLFFFFDLYVGRVSPDCSLSMLY